MLGSNHRGYRFLVAILLLGYCWRRERVAWLQLLLRFVVVLAEKYPQVTTQEHQCHCWAEKYQGMTEFFEETVGYRHFCLVLIPIGPMTCLL